jgi:hypothetical protein
VVTPQARGHHRFIIIYQYENTALRVLCFRYSQEVDRDVENTGQWNEHATDVEIEGQ